MTRTLRSSGSRLCALRRQMLALDAQHARIENNDALDDVLELAHISRPVIRAKDGERFFTDFDAWAAVLAPNSVRNSRASSGISCLRSRKGGTANGTTLSR